MLTSRRQFIRTTALAGVASSSLLPTLLTGPPASVTTASLAKVRLGFIGVGSRGRNHLKQALLRGDVEIPAICDPDPEAISLTNALIQKAGYKAPAAYTNGKEAYLQMLKRDDLDGVIIATPWEGHTPMAIATMKAGKYAGIEVSATVTLQESWDLVNASEQTGMPCMMLENVCYRRDVLAVLNMVRQGLFGQMTYAHCGYQHDLRADHIGTVYPTHGLGPVAHWFNINRGNRFVSLTSTVTKSRGLHKYVVDPGGASHPNVNFTLSDVVTTVIQCANGENIVLIHDTSSPRPYAPGFRAQGTNGIWMGDNNLISLDGITATATAPMQHNWEPFAAYQDKYDHPLWKKHRADAPGQIADSTGRGAMDHLVIRAFIESVKNKTQPPIDVYDAAVWRAISSLSAESIAGGSKPVAIPDFTRGRWETNKPVFDLNNLC